MNAFDTRGLRITEPPYSIPQVPEPNPTQSERIGAQANQIRQLMLHAAAIMLNLMQDEEDHPAAAEIASVCDEELRNARQAAARFERLRVRWGDGA
jgi:hypothetical protein